MENTKSVTTLAAMAKHKIGGVSRRDKMMIPVSMLCIEKGFNVRGIGFSEEEYWALEHIQEHIKNISYAYESGDYVPPIVVKFRSDDQMAVIRDGHHRYKALLMAVERGVSIERIEVTELKGDETSHQVLMLQSANQLALSPVERAEVIHRLFSYGLEQQEIADKIRKSIAYVKDMLRIYDLPLEKKRQIQMKEISYKTALTDERKENPKKAKQITPSKKVVREVMDVFSIFKDAPVIDGMVSVAIPVELLEQFLDGLHIENCVEDDLINQNSLPFLDDEE